MKITFEVRSFGANSGVDGYYGSFDISNEEISSAAGAYAAGTLEWVESLTEDEMAEFRRRLLKFMRSFETEMAGIGKGETGAEMPLWDDIPSEIGIK